MPIPAYMSITGESQENITEGANTEDSVGNDYQEVFRVVNDMFYQTFQFSTVRYS